MYKPAIGDVVKANGRTPMVVVDIKNYETTGNCSYDRKYLLCDVDYLEQHQGVITMTDLTQHGQWITVCGTKFPYIEKVDDIAPFSVESIDCRSIRQKTAKTITVYE